MSKKEKIMTNVEIGLRITLWTIFTICVLYSIIVFVRHFGYTPELGIYDTRECSFNMGEYLKYGKDAIHYTYTNLNFYEIMDRIW